MTQEAEEKLFLPKSSLGSGSVTVADSSQRSNVFRTRVKFITKNKDPTFTNLYSQKEAVFVFDPESTVQQAAEYAASHYPASNSQSIPIFHKVWVFFSESKILTNTMAVTDVEVNVHSMFREDDVMIVTNDANILDIQQKQAGRMVVTFFSGFGAFLIAFFGFIVFITWYYDLH